MPLAFQNSCLMIPAESCTFMHSPAYCALRAKSNVILHIETWSSQFQEYGEGYLNQIRQGMCME